MTPPAALDPFTPSGRPLHTRTLGIEAFQRERGYPDSAARRAAAATHGTRVVDGTCRSDMLRRLEPGPGALDAMS